MTLGAVARLADACNIIDGDVAEVRHKFDVLRRHCARSVANTTRSRRPYPALAACPQRCRSGGEARAAGCCGPLRGFVGTISEAIDLIGQYRHAGVDLMINADRRDDTETRELFAADVMPHFA
jgi:hypothetical protein